MSHEKVGASRSLVYAMPESPSDMLRSTEFTRFFHQYRGVPFCVRTADGWKWFSSEFRAPVFVATFKTRARLDAVINDSTETSLGRAFLNGELDVHGDLTALLAMAEYVFRRSGRLGGRWIYMLGRAGLDLSQRVRTARRQSNRKNWRTIACSWDLPIRFFQDWLGPSLSHTCVRFHGPDERLDLAQTHALERVCTLLELERGDRLLDLGCGCGSLLLHAAAKYRAEARGIASCEHQAEVIRDRVREQDLQRQCVTECRDLRSKPFSPESFDKIADIGIFEQVGYRNLREYFRCMCKMLAPGGLFLVHRMVRPPELLSRKTGALDTDLFPAAELESLSMELEAAESAGFEVRSVDNLKEAYEQTLRIWIGNLQRDPQLQTSHGSTRVYRRWLLFMVEIATALQSADLDVYQILLRRPAGGGSIKPQERGSAARRSPASD